MGGRDVEEEEGRGGIKEMNYLCLTSIDICVHLTSSDQTGITDGIV